MSNRLTPDQWQLLEPLLDALLDAPREGRATLYAELSGGDAARRAELERLVTECECLHPLLDRPATECFDALVQDAPLTPSQIIAGRYRIVRELGRGGMATVYLAHDVKHARDVALKVVRSELVATVGSGRFLREIQIAAQLRHPHIVPLYDSGNADGVLYYVMPYEKGPSLRERLRRDTRLSIDETLDILRDLCEALAHAHERGIVHRDIKPDNVLLSGHHALVTDFGVARAATEVTETTVTAAGVILGTPAYMAPEQIAADSCVDHRADLYALGIVAYELLTGAPPFRGDSAREILAAHLARTPESVTAIRPEVPDALGHVVTRCLEKEPDARWQSAAEIIGALEAGVAAAPLDAPTSVRPPRIRRRATQIAILAAAVIAGIGLTRALREPTSAISAVAPVPRLTVAILPVREASAGGELAWLATGLSSYLSAALAEVATIDLRPTETVDALMRSGLPLDSVALAREVDYFVRTVVSKGTGDSVVAAIELIERGIRSVRAGFIRVARVEATVDGLGRRVTERVRPMLGSRARDLEIEHGTTSSLALQLRRRGDHYRLIARERLRTQDIEDAARALDSAAALLVRSEHADLAWPSPRLARASLGELRALVVLHRSRGSDTAGVRRSFDASLAVVDSVVEANPRHARGLALRGRLEWQKAQLVEPTTLATSATVASAERDLNAALGIDTTLARAAADLSAIYAQARAQYGLAVAYAARADRLDSYMEESSQIIYRLALGNLELARDTEASRWCREGIRRFPDNPAHRACVLEVMAWGTEPVVADSVWHYYHELDRLRSATNDAARAFYATEVAAALARARGVPRDSARAVLAGVLRDVAANPATSSTLRDGLLPLEAAVLYRLGESTRADELFAQLVRRDPRRAALFARRRMLRDFVGSAGVPNKG